jgi:hypothetical protein
VIATRFRKRQRLADLTLIPQPTRPIVTFHHTGVDLLISQQIQHMLKACFAMHHADFNSIDPSAFIHLLDLPIGQTLPPAKHWQSALSFHGVTSTKDLQQSRLIAAKGISEDRW